MAISVATHILPTAQAAMSNTSLTAANLASAINLCLQDMGNAEITIDEEATGSLTATSMYIAEPTGYRSTISIVLTDANDNRIDPLEQITKADYEIVMSETTAKSDPRVWARFDSKIWLYPPPGVAFTYVFHYQRNHPFYSDGSSILYPDQYATLIAVGTTFFYAMLKGNDKWTSIWAPQYVAMRTRAAAARMP